MSATTKARRGDLIAVERTTRIAHASGPSTTSTRVELAVVLSITREGAIRRWLDAQGSEHHRDRSDATLYVVPRGARPGVPSARHGLTLQDAASKADALVVMDEARRCITWPGGQPGMPFHSLDECRTWLRDEGHVVPSAGNEATS